MAAIIIGALVGLFYAANKPSWDAISKHHREMYPKGKK